MVFFAGEVEDHGLLPANAIYEAPTLIDAYVPRWTGKKWEQIEDYKGKEGYLNGKPHTIKDYGSLPSGWSDEPPALTLEEARAAKITTIDAETSTAIIAGFMHPIDGQDLHFSYDTHDQQNFSDTANMAQLAMAGVPGIPDAIIWNGWSLSVSNGETTKKLVRLSLTIKDFLALYTKGALGHKATQMEIGGQRKVLAEQAKTIEELEAI